MDTSLPVCSACGSVKPPYRCPLCRQPYCSAACCQTHRPSCRGAETGAALPPPSKEEPHVRWDEGREHTVSDEALSWLGQSRRLRALLGNPHLRTLVTTADTTDTPDLTMRQLMQEPVFAEFTDECLRVVEGRAVDSDSDSDD